MGSIHGCSIKRDVLRRHGSSFIAGHADDFLVSGDKNFRPINLRWGHNGEIYCIDWHDQHPCHQTKPDDWDYAYGRVYRIQPKGLTTKKAEDLSMRPKAGLLTLLNDPNPYFARTALRLVQQSDVGANLSRDDMKQLKSDLIFDWLNSTVAKEAKGVYNPRRFEFALAEWSCDSDPKFIEYLLSHGIEGQKAMLKSNPALRREWASMCVRQRALSETNPVVRILLTHKEDAADPNIPQLLWLAYEPGLAKNPKDELTWLKNNAANNALITDTIVPRAMRRLVATGKREDLGLCLAFIGDLADSGVRVKALDGLVAGIGNRSVDAPHEWEDVQATLAKDTNADVKRLTNSLAIKFRDAAAIHRAMAVAGDATKPIAERAAAIRDLGVVRSPGTAPFLLELVRGKDDAELKVEAIRALGGIDQPKLSADLLAQWAKLTPGLRGEAVNVLAGRKDWAKDLLAAVGNKIVDRRDLNDNTILRIQALKDNGLNSQIEKVWGRMRATPAELNQLIDKMRGELAKAPGSFDRGKVIFDNQCAKCHKFDGRGHQVGPDIEGAGRDIEYILTNVLDPNRVIGSPYFMRTVTTLDMRTKIGVLHAEDDTSITLKTENGVLEQILKKDIDDVKVQEKSLMPEGLTKDMKEQDFRDLVRYVMANPFIISVEMEVAQDRSRDGIKARPVVGVGGRIALPDMEKGRVFIDAVVVAPEDMTVRLLVGSRADYIVSIGDRAAVPGKGAGRATQPDQSTTEVALRKGENRVRFVSSYQGRAKPCICASTIRSESCGIRRNRRQLPTARSHRRGLYSTKAHGDGFEPWALHAKFIDERSQKRLRVAHNPNRLGAAAVHELCHRRGADVDARDFHPGGKEVAHGDRV
jgi:putative heme-binding domain-containing protein